ncbi:MAG TPA: hypothetical protein VFA77_00765, partial [Candidatus Eisenbacteria bacterium]|nr:hypothetical protein [Candidatus Eisenbacteria bacterium]
KDACYVSQNITNHRPRRDDFSADVIEAIEEVSRLDLELYAFAQKLFRTTLRRRSGPLFKLKLARFKARNSKYRKRNLERAAA